MPKSNRNNYIHQHTLISRSTRFIVSLLSVCCIPVILIWIFRFLPQHTHAQGLTSLLNQSLIRVTDDQVASIEVSQSLFDTHPQPFWLEAFVISSSCPTSETELKATLYTSSECTKDMQTISITQSGSYQLQPPNDSLIVLTSCQHAENNCENFPDQLDILSISELSWLKERNSQTMDNQLSISQVELSD